MNPTITDKAIVVHDPFIDRLGGMIQRANARLGLDAKGNEINAGADGIRAEPHGTLAESTAASAPASYSGALVAQDFSGIGIPADAKHARGGGK